MITEVANHPDAPFGPLLHTHHLETPSPLPLTSSSDGFTKIDVIRKLMTCMISDQSAWSFPYYTRIYLSDSGSKECLKMWFLHTNHTIIWALKGMKFSNSHINPKIFKLSNISKHAVICLWTVWKEFQWNESVLSKIHEYL